MSYGDQFEHPGQVFMGTVGWDNETDIEFLGDADNDGNTLVRVQLFSGRDITKPLKDPKRAQGTKIICHLSGGLFRIPPEGTRVYVIIPYGHQDMVGVGMIIGTIEKTPVADTSVQFNKDRVSMDYGPDTDLVITARNVTIRSYKNEFISVGDARGFDSGSGIVMQSANGSGAYFQDNIVTVFLSDGSGGAASMLAMTPDAGVQLACKGTLTSILQLNDAGFATFAKTASLAASAVYLGKLPTAITGAAYGPNVAAGLTSTSVFISPA